MAPAYHSHHPLPVNPNTGHSPHVGTSRTGTPAGVSREVLRNLQDVAWSDEEDDPDCLLCAEPLDLSDLNFKPCQCGLQICQFCYNKLLTTDARCPGCRRPYDQAAVEFQPVEFEAIKRVKATKQQRAKINKQLEALGRRHLREVRIVMKNMVYVVGMKLPAPGDEAIPILRSNDYFGQYGKISKLSIKRPPPDSPNAQTGIYITYVRREDAQRAIMALDGIPAPQNPGQTLRASHGTTRYCDSFLRGVKCDNPSGCMGLHEWVGEGDTFTKEDLAAAFVKSKDPAPAPKVISIPAMQKSAWPKPSVDEAIDSSALPRSSNWGMRPAPVVPVTTRRAGKKHVLNLVPLGRPNASYAPAPAPVPTPTKEKKPPITIRTNSGVGMARVRSASSSTSTTSTPRLEALTTPVVELEREPEPEPEPESSVEPEPVPDVVSAPQEIPADVSEPTPKYPSPPPAAAPAQTFSDPAIASSSLTAPEPSSVQFPNYPIHSPYPEFDDVFAQHSDMSLAFSFGFDDEELERQIASGNFEPFAPFGAVLDGLPALGISGAISALIAVPPLGDEKSYAGIFDPFALDEDEGEAARKASRFGFARRPSSSGPSAPSPAPPQEIKWSATDPRIQQLQMHLQRGVSSSPDSLGPPPGLGRRDPSPFQDPAIVMMRPPPQLPLDPHSAQAHSTARMLQHLHQMRSPSPSPDETTSDEPKEQQDAQDPPPHELDFPALAAPLSARVSKVKKEKRQKVAKESTRQESDQPHDDLFSIQKDVNKEPKVPEVDSAPSAHIENPAIPEPIPKTDAELSVEPPAQPTLAPRAKVLRIPSISATPIKPVTPQPSATSTPVPSRPSSPSLSSFPVLGNPAISQASLAGLSVPSPASVSSTVSNATLAQDKDKKKRKKGGTKVKPPEPQVATATVGEQPAFAPRKKEKAFKPPVIKPPKAPKVAPPPPEPVPEPEPELPKSTESDISVVEARDDAYEGEDIDNDGYYNDGGEPVPVLTVAEMLAQINEVVDVQQFSSFFSPQDVSSHTSFDLATLDTAVAALAGISSDYDTMPDQMIKDDQARALRDLLHTMTRVCGEQYKLFPGSPKVLDSHFVLKGARQRVEGETESARKARLAHRGPVTNEMMRLQMEKIEDYKGSVNSHAIEQMLGRCSQAALADFASVAYGHSSIQELERALAAARQEEYAVATEFNMVRRENAKVLEEAALMW